MACDQIPGDEMSAETWKEVVGFPDYEVSDLGRVRGLSRLDTIGRQRRERVRKASPKLARYVQISLRSCGKTFVRRIHRVVLEAFRGPCPEGLEGCHNDGYRRNNALQNLRWDTHQSNMDDLRRQRAAA